MVGPTRQHRGFLGQAVVAVPERGCAHPSAVPVSCKVLLGVLGPRSPCWEDTFHLAQRGRGVAGGPVLPDAAAPGTDSPLKWP